jgi:hypothetical protein
MKKNINKTWFKSRKSKQSLLHLLRILKNEGPDIRESLQDSFRKWYMDIKKETGKFPDFPEEEEWKKADFKFGSLNIQASQVDLENPPKSAKSKADRSGPSSANSKKSEPKKPAKGQEEENSGDGLKNTQFMEDMKKLYGI